MTSDDADDAVENEFISSILRLLRLGDPGGVFLFLSDDSHDSSSHDRFFDALLLSCVYHYINTMFIISIIIELQTTLRT